MAGLLAGIDPYGSGVLGADAYNNGPGFPSIVGNLLSEYFKRFMALPPIQGGPVAAPAAAPAVPQPGQSAPAMPAPINIGTAPIDRLQSVDPASIPAAATPAQYAAPQPSAPAAQQTPDFLTKLTNGIAANPYMLMGLGSGIASGQGIGGGIKNAMAGSQLDMQVRNRNLTAGALLQALVARGYSPQQAWGLAQSVAGDTTGKLASALLPQALGLNPPKTLEEYAARRAYGETGPAGAGAPGASQPGQSGDPVADFLQFKQREAAATKAGETQGTNQANLPATLDVADQMLKNVDTVRSAPNLNDALGPLFGHLPAVGGKQADIVERINQLQSQAMLQGFQQLRGAGRITQAEMYTAGDALTRLSRLKSPGDFKQALDDLHGVLVAARTRAGKVAGVGPTPPPEQTSAASAAKPSGTTSSGIGWSVQ